MNTISMLKTLPLAGILALSLGLAPAVTMADDDSRGRSRDHVYKKHDGAKHHYREHRRSYRDHGPNKHGHHKGRRHGHEHYGHKHRGHKHYGHSHRGHKHQGHGRKHVDHIVVHNHYDDWDDYDRVRLLLGLHFDNIDLIYRDY